MTNTPEREQLHKYIDSLPDDIIQQLSDFALFLLAKRRIASTYTEWTPEQWQAFVLEPFFRDSEAEEEVEYTLNDAKEIYRP